MNVNKNEIKICGVRAVRALFARRPAAIRKVYLLAELAEDFAELLLFCRKEKLAFKIVENLDLEKVSASVHHEGIVAFATEANQWTLGSFYPQIEAEKQARLILLENVDNPHNLGSIIRSAAFFGVHGIIIASGNTRSLSSATYRTSEGAAEFLPVIFSTNAEAAVKFLKSKSFAVVATSPHAIESMYDAKIPARAVFVFGTEGTGLRAATISAASLTLRIPGSGLVESLNVSQAVTAVLAVAASLSNVDFRK